MTDPMKQELKALSLALHARTQAHSTTARVHTLTRHTLLTLLSVTALQIVLDPASGGALAARVDGFEDSPIDAQARVAATALGVARELLMLAPAPINACATALQQVGDQTVLLYIENGQPMLIAMDRPTGDVVRRMLTGHDVLRDLAAQVSA